MWRSRRLRHCADDSAPQATPPRDVAAGRASTGTAVIRGRVVAAETGRPLTLATITASAPELRESRSISTNSEGRYELRNLPAGRYTLSIAHSGYLRLQYGQRRPLELGKPIDVAAAAIVDNIDFVLPRMSVISGRVTDEEGEPIAGARVTAMPSSPYGDRRSSPPIGIGFVQTDDSGAYRIIGLSPGSYVVMADPASSIVDDGRSRRDAGRRLRADVFSGCLESGRGASGVGRPRRRGANTDFSLVPTRLATITGTVIDSRGRPVAEPAIAIVRQVAGTCMLSAPLGREDQRCRERSSLQNLPPGEITLDRGQRGPGVLRQRPRRRS